MVVYLAAAAVRPGGVVLALAAQLLFVIHTAVGVEIALAPVEETETGMKEENTSTLVIFLICFYFLLLQDEKQTSSLIWLDKSV